MKILIATSTVTPNAGIPSYNRELCAMLNVDHEVHLLVGEQIDEYTGYCKVYSTCKYEIYSYSACKALVDIINSERYDVIINSNSHHIALLAPYIYEKTRIITISHSLGTMDCDNAAINHTYVDCIVALSSYAKKYISQRFRISQDKINVVFNAVKPLLHTESIREEKKSKNTINIVFAGGSAPSKSPELVVEIISRLVKTDLQFQFYWMSLTTPPLKKIQPFKSIYDVLPSDGRICVTGMLPHDEASKLIASCNIFLAPSKREGFPMALLEAMRVGCIPIVADFNIANKEIIEDGFNGFIIPHDDIDGYVNRISDIIKNHARYADVYDASYNTYITQLTDNIWREKMNILFNDLNNNHFHRKASVNRLHYFANKFRFKLIDRINYIENMLFEVLPSAYRMYNQFLKK